MRRKELKNKNQTSPERLAKILDVPQNMFESYSQMSCPATAKRCWMAAKALLNTKTILSN